MKKKLLNKGYEEAPAPSDIEHKLLSRLNFMGYILCIIGLVALVYAIFAPREPWIEPETTQLSANGVMPLGEGTYYDPDEDLLELSPTEVLNFYGISFMFVVIGAACFFISWKKRKILFHKIHTHHEN